LGGDGTEGLVLEGIGRERYENAGFSVSAAGDVNGDGVGDLLIGAPNLFIDDAVVNGGSYVVFGRSAPAGEAFPARLPLASLFPADGGDGSAGFVITGVAFPGDLGLAVSDAGDLNDDGIDDIVVAAPLAHPRGESDAGETYAVFGRDTSLSPGFPALFSVGRLLPEWGGDGVEGFVMPGPGANDSAGWSVSAAGDVNGDGLGDLIVGAPGASRPGRSTGESFVLFGRHGASDPFDAIVPLAGLLPPHGDGTTGFVMMGVGIESSGQSVSAAGDVNGDGIGDVVIGAFNASTLAGRAYVVFGRDTARSGTFPALLPLASLLPDQGGDGSAGFVLSGVDIDDLAGHSVSAAGDVNGDGIGDLLIGAPQVDNGLGFEGASYVVFGRSTATHRDN
jgi:glycosylphosphatidylinositol phospholipase D